MNVRNPHGSVGYSNPGRRGTRTIGRRVSPWALCRVCGSEVTDERFRDHPQCLTKQQRRTP